jgi:mono/diheme cytochrome c family protein
MRRLAPLLVGCTLLLAACGGAKTVSPVPNTIEGSVPKPQVVKGDATAGKAVYASQGCGSCHTYGPAGSSGKVGPDLANIPADAKKANQGTVDDYVKTSIQDPNAYVVSGFPKGVMPAFTSLSPKQIADLVAFLTQSS